MIVMSCNAFSENTVLIPDGEGGVLVFDPGFSTSEEWARFDEVLKENGWQPSAVLLTHAHLDHVMGCCGMHARFELHPRLHADDRVTYGMATHAAELYGVPLEPLPAWDENPLEDGQELAFGKVRLQVRHTPGHAPGHVVFVDHDEARIVGGDVLFQGSIGRTDLPGGNAPQLATSIEEVLYTLPDHYTVVPGHGPATSIGVERAGNPFVNAAGTGMLQRT
jgi:glyoxylase-like metal-dependent hydrolase (beta-lactamase superfamily II)